MSEDESLCSCEQLSHGKDGSEPVDNPERLARVVTYPNHFLRDGSVKPGVFPPKHIRESGLSLMRVDKMDEAELTKQAHAVAMCKPGETVSGVLLGETGRIREVLGGSRRSLCVKDDPVMDNERLPDNPAHAIAIRSLDQDEPEILRIRGELVKLFSGLTPIAEVYGREGE